MKDMCCQILEGIQLQNKKLKRQHTQLLISYKDPHKPIATGTVARWIKEGLGKSGIDTTVFAAHSTRSASASLVQSKGLDVTETAKAASWTNCRTFAKFYEKPIEVNFGQVIQEQTNVKDS